MTHGRQTRGRTALIGAALFQVFALAAAAGNEPATAGDARSPARAQFDKAHPNYLGWRIFQQKCAECHGADATGSAKAPDLLPRVAQMSERRFAHTVLHRYVWLIPSAEAGAESAAREAFIEQVLRRETGAIEMPAWQDEPHVSTHIGDLYAYLRARSQGALPPGRPAP